MKVELELKNGKRRSFHPQVANVLVARGLGWESAQGYMTREMRAADPTPVPQATTNTNGPDELDALKAEADKRGIKYHHRAGAAKLRELLED